MTPLLFGAIAIAGGVGSALRLLVDGAVRARSGGRLPWGTLAINVSGSLLLGLLLGLLQAHGITADVELVLGTGLLGGYTTFSTASVETVRLLQARRVGASFVNGFGMLAVAVVAALAGYGLGRLL